jgi:hypothetical protein
MTQEKNITMNPDEYEHNIKVLTSITEIKTLQKVSNKEFMDHKKEDKVHFDRLYDSIEDLVAAVALNASNAKVFQTKVLYAVMGAITLGTTIGTLLNIFITGSKLVS